MLAKAISHIHEFIEYWNNAIYYDQEKDDKGSNYNEFVCDFNDKFSQGKKGHDLLKQFTDMYLICFLYD